MKKGTSLEKQVHPLFRNGLWKPPPHTGGLTLPAVPRFWNSFALSAFQTVAHSLLRDGLALRTPHSLLVGRCWQMGGSRALAGSSAPLSDGSQNPHTQMGTDSGKLARCPARQAHPWTALVRGTKEAFLGVLQGQGAAAENTGHPEPGSLGSSQASGMPSARAPGSPLPFPRPARASPGVTAAYSTSGPGSSGDSEHHLAEALEGGFARGRLLGFSVTPP